MPIAENNTDAYLLALEKLDELITLLINQSYRVIGPKLDNGVIRLQEISSSSELPQGLSEIQEPGRYKIKPYPPDSPLSKAYFAHRNGPDSAREKLLPQRTELWSARREKNAKGFEIFYPPRQQTHTQWAFLGLRACDIAAIALQDRIFLEDNFQQRTYEINRNQCLIIAVQCTTHASTCFCTSQNTGPKVQQHFDLALTEVCEQQSHWFLAQTGSALGQKLCQSLALPQANTHQQQTASGAVEENARAMQHFDFSTLKTALKENPEHPWWETIGEACLSCANCTLVCPTCFCTSVEDTTDLTGQHTQRWLTWDSCFNEQHSYIHGGQVHKSIPSRYRQWLTHKLSTWHDQFQSSGCVGCGRCISWCPVGIDLRETIDAFKQDEPQNTGHETSFKDTQERTT